MNMKWQTKEMADQINKIGEYGQDDTDNIIETTEQNLEQVHEFCPDIKLIGYGLRDERKKSWGGFYYRVLKQKGNEEDRCIQWLYVWTKQMFFSLLEPIIVCAILSFLGLLAFTFSYNDGFEFGGILGIVLISTFCLIFGGYRFGWMLRLRLRERKKFYFHNSMLLLLWGSIFVFILLEKTPIFELNFWDVNWRIPKVSLILAIIALIITCILLVFQKMHDMDWAPLFIYIKNPNNEGWQLDKIIYDEFHYYTRINRVVDLDKKFLDNMNKKIQLAIPNSWHSFNLFNSDRNLIYTVTGQFLLILLGVFGVIINYIFSKLHIELTDNLNRLLLSLVFIVGPIMLYMILNRLNKPLNQNYELVLFFFISIGMLILFLSGIIDLFDWKTGDFSVYLLLILFVLSGIFVWFSKSLSDLIPEEDTTKCELKKDIYHLTEERIRLFWNLKENASLVVRTKFRNPFITDDDEFSTFRDP